jgi:hypothetical protein
MATVSDSTPQYRLEVELRRRRTAAFGFLWGAAALVIFAFWFWLKPLPAWLTVNLFIAAGVALFVAVYQIVARGGGGDETARLERLKTEDRFFSILLLTAGAIFLIVASLRWLRSGRDGVCWRRPVFLLPIASRHSWRPRGIRWVSAWSSSEPRCAWRASCCAGS